MLRSFRTIRILQIDDLGTNGTECINILAGCSELTLIFDLASLLEIFFCHCFSTDTAGGTIPEYDPEMMNDMRTLHPSGNTLRGLKSVRYSHRFIHRYGFKNLKVPGQSGELSMREEMDRFLVDVPASCTEYRPNRRSRSKKPMLNERQRH